MKRFLIGLVVLLVLVGGGLGAAAAGLICAPQIWQAMAQPSALAFRDAAMTAANTGRIGLAPALLAMGDHMRAFEAIPAHSCMNGTRNAMLVAMTQFSRGMQAFAASDEERSVDLLTDASESFQNAIGAGRDQGIDVSAWVLQYTPIEQGD